MHPRIRLFALSVAVASIAAPCARALHTDGPSANADEPAPPITLGRADLAAAYLRFDRLFAHRPATGDALVAVNRRFDRITGLFFRGDASVAVAALADLSADLAGGDDEDRLFASVVATIEPRVVDPCTNEAISVTLRALAAGELAAGATLALRDGAGRLLASAPVTVNGRATRVSLPLDALRDIPADYELALERDGEASLLLGRIVSVCGSLDALREGNERLLGAIDPAPELEQALGAALSRNRLLADDPSAGESTTLVAGLGAIAASMPGDIEALQNGRNPYKHKPGHWWRTFRLGETDIPVRIYAPKGAARDGAPLVIALHGAGGDENLFPDGYGAGLITRLADERGFIVASPRTEFFLANPAAFETLIEVMRADYDIDPARVYAVGHSLGAVAITSAAAQLVGRLAAGVCLAGPVFVAPAESSPAMLLVAATLDPIATPGRVTRYVEAGERAGVAIEYRQIEGQGHTLMVNEALAPAIDWLLERRLDNR